MVLKEELEMNKSMLMGLLGGVGIATAGGVAGFVMLGEPSASDAMQGSVEPEPTAAIVEPMPVASAPAQPVAVSKPQPASAPAPAPRQATVAAAPPAPAPVTERCWDEEVVVPVEPTDEHAIAGTTAGALLGGAIAKKIGDDNKVLTVAGAVGGALAGRRVQQKIQENNTTTRIERRCEPIQAQ
jgi:uncharacterized protein YcfJ